MSDKISANHAKLASKVASDPIGKEDAQKYLDEALMDLEHARPGLLGRWTAGGTLCRNANSRPIAEGRRCTGVTALASKRSLNEHEGFSSTPVCPIRISAGARSARIPAGWWS